MPEIQSIKDAFGRKREKREMNIPPWRWKRQGLAVIVLLLFTLSLTGCVFTRLTEITWKTGVRQYYADLSATTGEVFFIPSGRAYLRARECAFEEEPAFLGMIAGPFSFRGSGLARKEIPEKFVLIELAPETAAILTSPGGKQTLLPSAHGFFPVPEKDSTVQSNLKR